MEMVDSKSIRPKNLGNLFLSKSGVLLFQMEATTVKEIDEGELCLKVLGKGELFSIFFFFFIGNRL